MDNDTLLALANQLGKLLKERSLKLALAESCTGGMASQYITAVAGSSVWFDRAFITYSNQAKIEMLHVSKQTLEDFGAVSEQTAHEMALNALNSSVADITASITGIAGPDGGTDDKPVGTVCFGFASKNKLQIHQTIPLVSTHSIRFTGSRDAIRKQSVTHTLETLITLTLSIDL